MSASTQPTRDTNVLSQITVGALLRFGNGDFGVTAALYPGSDYQYLTWARDGSAAADTFTVREYSFDGEATAKITLDLSALPGQFWNCAPSRNLPNAVLLSNEPATILLYGGEGSVVTMGAPFGSPDCTGNIALANNGEFMYLNYCSTDRYLINVDIVG